MMRRSEHAPPINYSNNIISALQWIDDMKQKYQECEDYMKYANDATQDLLHAMELCITTAPERHMLYSQMSEIRKNRRTAKNEQAILTPLIIWCRDHERELKSLEGVIYSMKKIEENLNSERYYRSRTNVVEELFGTPVSVLDLPEDFGKPKENSVSTKEETEENKEDPLPVGKTETNEDENTVKVVDDTMNEILHVTIEYPVVIYFHKKKRTGTYYYTFPGLEKSLNPHSYPSGDHAMNLNNKKLMRDIELAFSEVIMRFHEPPQPVPMSQVNPDQIRKGMRLGAIKDTKIIMHPYECSMSRRELLQNHFI